MSPSSEVGWEKEVIGRTEQGLQEGYRVSFEGYLLTHTKGQTSLVRVVEESVEGTTPILEQAMKSPLNLITVRIMSEIWIMK